jgi:16S rRNA (guanine966-N2)-methyltransferase
MNGRIRIIGGRWRGRKLSVPDAPGLRPTGDRARETLFNWLQAHVAGARCLDLFAGTGALGLEALSRGAASAVFVERDRRLADALRDVGGGWPGGERMEVVETDAMRWLAEDDRRFDLVFVDPPFSDGLQARVLAALVEGDHLATGARVYVEQDAREPVIDPDERYEVLRRKTLGEVRMTLLARR